MRGAMIMGINQPLEVRDDLEISAPGPGEVHVKVAATGVCHSDISLQNGVLPHPMPVIPGHEASGVVLGVGEGITHVAEGDHVIMAIWPACWNCWYCLNGSPHLCETFTAQAIGASRVRTPDTPLFSYAGLGTMAEEAIVIGHAAVPIPKDVPFDVAALIGCGVATGVGAVLNTAKVRPGSSVVVFGCGGVGISVIQGARIAGAADIVAVDLLDAKLEEAKRFGATHAVKPNELFGVSQEVTDGRGFDYAFEVVGRPETIRSAWDATRRGGMTVVVGAGAMDAMVPFSAFELFYQEKTLQGCWYGSANVRVDFPKLLAFWRNGQLDLEGMITRRITLDGINEAFEACAKGEVVRSLIEFDA
jgi:S-(hydroxymethyl)glutathione dehydrogenase / alcohol dehydrogenase